MGAHDFKLIKVPLFSRKSVNINVSRSAAPKLALMPASRYYWDETGHTTMSLPSFIRIEKGFRWGLMISNLTRCLFLL